MTQNAFSQRRRPFKEFTYLPLFYMIPIESITDDDDEIYISNYQNDFAEVEMRIWFDEFLKCLKGIIFCISEIEIMEIKK